MADPISRLQLAEQEIDRVFGPGYAGAHPELVGIVVSTAATDYAAQLLAGAIEHVAMALVEEETGTIMPPRELLRVRP